MLLGLAAVLVVPAAVAVAQRSRQIHLLDASFAIPVAVVLGVVAIRLARGALARVHWTVGRSGGEGRARAARLLGLLGICLAITAAIAVGVFELLTSLER